MRKTRQTMQPREHDGVDVAREGNREPRSEDLISHLDRDQFVAETARRLPRASLSARAAVGLWALRVVVVLVGAMVAYAFVVQLH